MRDRTESSPPQRRESVQSHRASLGPTAVLRLQHAARKPSRKVGTLGELAFRGQSCAGVSMEEIRIDSVVDAKIVAKERMYMPPIIVTIEAESPRGRLALKFTAVALKELLSHLRSLK